MSTWWFMFPLLVMLHCCDTLQGKEQSKTDQSQLGFIDRSARSYQEGDMYLINDDVDDYSFAKDDGTLVKVCDERDWAPDSVRPTFSFGRFNRVVRCMVGCSAVTGRSVDMLLWKVGHNYTAQYVDNDRIKKDYYNYNPAQVHQAYANVPPERGVITYKCQATDSQNMVLTRTIELHFYRSAVLDYGHSRVERINRTTVEITCMAQGRPAPNNVSMELTYRNRADFVISRQRKPRDNSLSAQPDDVQVDGEEVIVKLATTLNPKQDPNVEVGSRLYMIKCTFGQEAILDRFPMQTQAIYLYVNDYL